MALSFATTAPGKDYDPPAEAEPPLPNYYFDCGFDMYAQQQSDGKSLAALVCVQETTSGKSPWDFCRLVANAQVKVRIYDITVYAKGRRPPSYTISGHAISFTNADGGSDPVPTVALATPPANPTSRDSVAFGAQYNSWDAGSITLTPQQGRFQMTVEFTVSYWDSTGKHERTFRRDPEVIVGTSGG